MSPRAKPEERVRLPLAPSHLEPGYGARAPCRLYDDCLSGFVVGYLHTDLPAQCPGHLDGTAWVVTCRWWEPPARLRATEYASTGVGIGGET